MALLGQPGAQKREGDQKMNVVLLWGPTGNSGPKNVSLGKEKELTIRGASGYYFSGTADLRKLYTCRFL